MIRVRDPVTSRHFYETVLGMNYLCEIPMEAGKFTLHFLAFDVPENIKAGSYDERRAYAFSVPGVLELTHNWGTESDPSFAGYSSGNSDPGRGFGHIAVCVDNIVSFCEYLEQNQVLFKKRLQDGNMKNIAFALDPDGYWVEILEKRFQ
ncbi:Lactoylglutathione lyase [Blyttiomyces sp. JEL0837]|nr:Lactoylglutathione lyase [Blyttiomyces sp. JEL0837]